MHILYQRPVKYLLGVINQLPLIVLILSLLPLLLQRLFHSIIITTKNSNLFQAVMHTKGKNHHMGS